MSDLIAKATGKLGAHKISTHPHEGTVRVEHDGAVLAESARAIALEETGIATRYYLPREDVRTDLLELSATRTHCPFKGDATYFSAAGVADAFWVYEAPDKADAEPIAGMLAPWPGRVEIVVD